MSLVGTAGKHSLGRDRKSHVEAEPKGHDPPGLERQYQAGSGCGCCVSLLGESHYESGTGIPSAHGACKKPCAHATRGVLGVRRSAQQHDLPSIEKKQSP